MRLEKDTIDKLFDDLQGSFDTELPSQHHAQNFAERLQEKKQESIVLKPKTKKSFVQKWWMVAASVVILISAGLFTLEQQNSEVATLSPEVVKAQTYFASIINTELEKLDKEKSSPLTKKIISDAMIQLDKLEKDYNKLEEELIEDGENKKLIYAMITNFQMRIELLQNVLNTIDEVKTLNTETHENTI
ncbi:hypothetical protein SAMN05216480_10760 [Pustulibacterium marinum]|uniref:Anti-sigma factor n=1 Tax=Pustulibacterium marinum TaxID=1224947 RepID=A0A1I7H4T2_9FLAO|nr:hypothetical protein [Pustulibacterium marinum]SFU55717.1 hypothetical protein SAMN05216480_10760 [Pustulibacterium marinum]